MLDEIPKSMPHLVFFLGTVAEHSNFSPSKPLQDRARPVDKTANFDKTVNMATGEIQTQFGMRLKRARVKNGLSLRNLAERLRVEGVEVSHAALGKYEKGMMLPDSEKLIALCDVLDVEPDDFFRAETVKLENIEFRKLSDFGKKKVDRIREEAVEFFERYLEIETTLGIPRKRLERIDLRDRDTHSPEWTDEAEAVAEKVRRDWSLGQSALPNVHELLESQGVKVKEVEADEGFDGFAGWADDETPVIVLSKKLNEDLPRKRLTALHELGHLIVEFPESASKKALEAFCFRFAGAMLIPKDAMIRNLGIDRPNGITIYELQSMKEDWGISISALMRRAKDLNIITQARYEHYCIGNRKIRKTEPGIWQGSETANRFRQLVIRALSQEAITRSKAAELLRIDAMRVEKLMNEGVE